MPPIVKKHFCLLAFAFALAACVGCSEDITDTVSDVGSVRGYFFLGDEFGARKKEHSGITVSLEGTNYSTVTDSLGDWVLVDIPTGSYTVRFSKEGYISRTDVNCVVPANGTFFYDIPHLNYPYCLGPGGDFLSVHDLVTRQFEDEILTFNKDSTYFKISSGRDTIVRVAVDSLFPNELARFSITTTIGKISSGPKPRTISYITNIYCSRKKDVDPIADSKDVVLFEDANYPESALEGSEQETSVYLARRDLLAAGFRSGETVYCAAYTTPYYLYNYLFDPFLHDLTPGAYSIHHSEVKSFIIP
jgi:hypothetical protein